MLVEKIKKEHGKPLLYLIRLNDDNIFYFYYFMTTVYLNTYGFFKTVYLFIIYKIDDKEEGINLLWINRFFCLK